MVMSNCGTVLTSEFVCALRLEVAKKVSFNNDGSIKCVWRRGGGIKGTCDDVWGYGGLTRMLIISNIIFE